MDIRKLKVTQLLIGCLCAFYSTISIAQIQYDIPIYVTTTNDTISNLKARISANTEVDFIYKRTDTAYMWGYGGFNNLLVEDQVFPIHLEQNDDFNVALFKTDSLINLVFSGAQGALKNEYILNRDEAFKNFSNQKGFWSQNKASFEESLDSLVYEWSSKLNNSIHSDIFKTDEQAYYDSYALYMKLLKGQIIKGKIDLMDLNKKEFPEAIYDIERYYTTIPAYKNLSIAYHYANVKNLERSRDIRKYYYDLPQGLIRFGLREQLMKEVSERHPKSKLFYKAMDYRYDPRPDSEKVMYRNIERTAIGTEFIYPEAKVLDSKPFDFSMLGSKKVYFFMYDLNDPNLSYNLKIWNSMVVGSVDKDAYYIACALQSQNSEIEFWRGLQLNQKVAGVNVIALEKDTELLKNAYGVQYFPRIIIVDKESKIKDSNLETPFIKVKMLVQDF
ncbi:hypothetical protein [Nonlabens antarcticus]|uniref:hypothetical protein n=1 Tax=Nonlabens antarcticus TaxID=392714 RepID=UPI0018918E03|nr:hypothetical protein [Nonlabens antarcticus]